MLSVVGRKQHIHLKVFWVQVCQLHVNHGGLDAFLDDRVESTQMLSWTK
jgi:hypothetical protein